MRAFLGIPASDVVADRLGEAFSELAKEEPIKAVRPENYHITVKFLGEIDQKLSRELASKLTDRLKPAEALELNIRYAGVFPDPGNPRVIWAGAGPEEPLERLNTTCEEAAFELGVAREEREYHPHLTLGRIKKKISDRRLVINWLKEYGREEFGRIDSPELVLYESELTSEGPQYRELEKWQI